MPLSIEQIREMIASFQASTLAKAEYLDLSVRYRTEEGESITLTHSYSLEGIFPTRETSEEMKRCTLCVQQRPVEDGHTFCSVCESGETYDDDEFDVESYHDFGDEYDE